MKLEDSRVVPPGISSELTEDRLGELLNSLIADSGLKAHRLAVREAKSQRFGEDVERFLVLLLVSTAIAGVGAYLFFNGRPSLKVILATLVGAIGVFASLFGLAAGIPKAIRHPTSQSVGGLREACLGFYSHALSRVSDEHGFFFGACEYFPLPVLLRYVVRSESLLRLEARWREVREELAGMEYSIHLDGMNIAEQPRSDPRLVDVVVHFRSERHGQLSVRNVAFCLNGQWFLATPEPVQCDAS